MSSTGAQLSTEPFDREETFQTAAEQQLKNLCKAFQWDGEVAPFLAVQRLLFEGWGAIPIPTQPAFPSLIGDDHSPYEYSLAFQRNAVDLRILCEAQSREADLGSSLARAQRINQGLAQRYGVDFSRYDSIADLFLRPDSDAAFLLWHGVSLAPGHRPEFKVYLNPQVEGPSNAKALLAEALARLGISSSTANFIQSFAERCRTDECTYLSLDLVPGPLSRVKVYFAHQHARASELDRAFACVPSHRAGDVTAFCRTVMGSDGPFLQKPLTSCLAFVGGRPVPTGVTLHAPVAHYLADDAISFANISSYMAQQGLNVERYRAALEAFASRPLSNGPGIHSYASIRRENEGMRVTTYLSPELFDNGSSRSCVYSKLI